MIERDQVGPLMIPAAARLRPGDLIRILGPGSWEMTDVADARRDELVRRLRSLRDNYAHRAEHVPLPALSWGDAVGDLDDVLAALDGLTWTQRRGWPRLPETAPELPE